jgi:hypothetical protein
VSRCRGAQTTVRNYRLHVRRYLSPFLDRVLLWELHPGHVKSLFVRLLRDGIDGRPVTVATAHAVYKALCTALNARSWSGG